MGSLMAICLAGGSLYLLWRFHAPLRGGGARAGQRLLFGLRAALLLALVYLLLYPTYQREEHFARPPLLTLLVDDSLSMGLPAAAEAGDTRLERALAALDGPTGIAARLRQAGWRVETRALSTLQPLRETERLEPRAETTNFSAALEQLAVEGGSRPSAVWLISDGVVTAGGDPAAAALALGATITTLGVGEASRWRDVRVVDLVLPPRIFRGERTPVSALLAREPNGPARVEAALMVDQATVAAAVIEFGDDIQALWQPEEPLVFDSTGAHTIRVVLASGGEGDSDANNQLERSCLVEAERLRVAILYGPLSPLLGSLRRALISDERLEVTTALHGLGTPWMTMPAYRQRERAGNAVMVEPRLPREFDWSVLAAGLAEFDLIVIGNLDLPTLEGGRVREPLQTYVENGGALLWLGRESAFGSASASDSAWAPLIPVDLERSRGVPAVQPLNLVLTPAGREHPLAIGLRRLDELRTPPLLGVNLFVDAGAGAQRLIEARDAAGNVFPFMVSRRLGLGRTALVAGGRLWLWPLQLATPDAPTTGAELLKGFWRGMVHNLCGETGGAVGRVHVAAGRVFTGEPVRVWASLGYVPTMDALPPSVNLRVTTPEGGRERVALALTEPETNLYSGTYTPVSPGTHHMMLETTEGSEETSAEAQFVAEQRQVEYLSPYRDDDLMERLAALTGGDVADLSEWSALAGRPAQAPRVETRSRALFLGAHPVVLTCLLGLLAGEWLLRRRHQLT